MPIINRDSLLAVDIIEAEEGLPFRFATNIDVDMNMKNSGKWTQLENGDNLWQLEIYSQNAQSISFIYENFNIPKGATYYIYNPLDTSKVMGGFTFRNNARKGQPFSSGMMIGNRFVLEYYEPKGVEYRGDISIIKTTHGYKSILKYVVDYTNSGLDKAFGDSEPCNNDINCPEWSSWQDVMKSVAMITLDSNTRFCTGALINNYNEDEKNYFLTAEHCTGQHTDTEAWVLYFRYEQAVCDSTFDGNLSNFVNGGNIKALGDIFDGDFLLLELTPDTDTIPSEYDIYYAGWSALSTPATSSVTIHHPEGDVKKISIDRSQVTGGLLRNHWYATYFPADSGTGLVEGGSSGAPLFDQNFRIVGQHTGGSSPQDVCTTPGSSFSGSFGKFAYAWNTFVSDSTKHLKYWLDPLNIGITTLDGLYPNASCCMPPIRGNVDYDPLDIIDITDLVFMVNFMFCQGYPPACEAEADVDGSTEIDISDLLYLADYMFGSPTGPAPAVCP